MGTVSQPFRKNPIPKIWQPQAGSRLITDALKDTASRRNFIISISSLDTLPSLRDILSTRAPPSAPTMPETAAAIVSEPALEPAKPAPKQAANRAHKRQISEAIPRNERAEVGKAHLEKEDHTHYSNGGAGNGGAGSGGAGTECRRSGRVRKPKQHN